MQKRLHRNFFLIAYVGRYCTKSVKKMELVNEKSVVKIYVFLVNWFGLIFRGDFAELQEDIYV